MVVCWDEVEHLAEKRLWVTPKNPPATWPDWVHDTGNPQDTRQLLRV